MCCPLARCLNVTQPDSQAQPIIGQSQLRRERLRFTRFAFTRTPNGRCAAEVELEWLDDDRVVGRVEGMASAYGDLRLAADATLRAIEAFSKGELEFELIGVKTMRAFDANVVIVSIQLKRGGESQRLLGCHLADDDQLRGAVISTLQATNRVLGNFVATR